MKALQLIQPRELVTGDEIAEVDEKGRVRYHNGHPVTTKVTRVEHYACSQHGTHVNGGSCYTWSIPVHVLR